MHFSITGLIVGVVLAILGVRFLIKTLRSEELIKNKEKRENHLFGSWFLMIFGVVVMFWGLFRPIHPF